ncbi:MAG: glycosyltransferase, partial [Microlunatus sp.]|nr:glycosyltransferase [Microlunatus sp.]
MATYLTDAASGWPRGIPVVLYGTDDYQAGARLMGVSGSWLEDLERRCLTEADAVVAVSDELATRWAGIRPGVQTLRNGCRVLSSDGADRPTRSAARLPYVSPGSPVVGLVGQLSARISLDVLEAIADAGISLLLVGPVDPHWPASDKFKVLCRRNNVEYVGRVDPSELMAFFELMDVGITPYADSPFNTASFPLKTLEYLGAGLPVVASDIAPSRWVRRDLESRLGTSEADRHFRLAVRPAEFVTEILTLARSGGRHDPSRRQQYAAHHTWESRTNT